MNKKSRQNYSKKTKFFVFEKISTFCKLFFFRSGLISTLSDFFTILIRVIFVFTGVFRWFTVDDFGGGSPSSIWIMLGLPVVCCSVVLLLLFTHFSLAFHLLFTCFSLTFQLLFTYFSLVFPCFVFFVIFTILLHYDCSVYLCRLRCYGIMCMKLTNSTFYVFHGTIF